MVLIDIMYAHAYAREKNIKNIFAKHLDKVLIV